MHLRNRHHISRQPPAPKRTSKPYHKNGWRRRCRRQQHSPHTTQTNAACRPRQTARVHPTSGADGGVAAADNIGPDRQAFDQSSFTSIFRTILIRNSAQGLCFKRWLVRREVRSSPEGKGRDGERSQGGRVGVRKGNQGGETERRVRMEGDRI